MFNPLSKINRMDYTKSDYIFKNSTLLLIILIFVTIFYNIFSLNIDYYSFYKDLFATKQGFSLFFESLILSLIYIFIFEFVYNVLMLMVRTGLYSFKIKDIEVTNEELVDDKNSLLDKYKSEIIHFF